MDSQRKHDAQLCVREHTDATGIMQGLQKTCFLGVHPQKEIQESTKGDIKEGKKVNHLNNNRDIWVVLISHLAFCSSSYGLLRVRQKQHMNN